VDQSGVTNSEKFDFHQREEESENQLSQILHGDSGDQAKVDSAFEEESKEELMQIVGDGFKRGGDRLKIIEPIEYQRSGSKDTPSRSPRKQAVPADDFEAVLQHSGRGKRGQPSSVTARPLEEAQAAGSSMQTSR